MGRKVRARSKGGQEQQAGDGEEAVLLTEQIMDDVNKADKAQHHCAFRNAPVHNTSQPHRRRHPRYHLWHHLLC